MHSIGRKRDIMLVTREEFEKYGLLTNKAVQKFINDMPFRLYGIQEVCIEALQHLDMYHHHDIHSKVMQKLLLIIPKSYIEKESDFKIVEDFGRAISTSYYNNECNNYDYIVAAFVDWCVNKAY